MAINGVNPFFPSDAKTPNDVRKKPDQVDIYDLDLAVNTFAQSTINPAQQTQSNNSCYSCTCGCTVSCQTCGCTTTCATCTCQC